MITVSFEESVIQADGEMIRQSSKEIWDMQKD
jgi:hypothetical protein